MRFFRSNALAPILFCLVLVLHTAGPFSFAERQGDEKGAQVISSPQGFDKLNGQIRQIQIKYGFHVIHFFAVTTHHKIVSEDYIAGSSLDPLSADFFTYPDRGPPHHASAM